MYLMKMGYDEYQMVIHKHSWSIKMLKMHSNGLKKFILSVRNKDEQKKQKRCCQWEY